MRGRFAPVLLASVHGILHTHARDIEAVRAFVEACRFPFQTIEVGDQLGQGQRGAGGQGRPAALWGVTPQNYVKIADPWPLNSSWHDPHKTEQENVQFLFDWGVNVISCQTEETKEVGLRLRPR